MRRKFFPVRLVRRWQRLPGEAMDASFLEVQGQVEQGSGPVGGIPARGGGWDKMSFIFPSSQNHSFIL